MQIFTLELARNSAATCGIGLLLSESRELLGKLQGVVLQEQADEILRRQGSAATAHIV